MFKISCSKPLNTDKIIIRAAVPMSTPNMLMLEIIFIAFTDFFENKYRFAINRGVFIILSSYKGVRSFLLSHGGGGPVTRIDNGIVRKLINFIRNALDQLTMVPTWEVRSPDASFKQYISTNYKTLGSA